MKRRILAAIIAATTTFTTFACDTPFDETAYAASTASAENNSFLQYPVPDRVVYYRPGNLMVGDDIRFVQAAINHVLGTNYSVNGVADEWIDEEIRAYQDYADLEKDGCAGPATIASLEKDLFENVTFVSGYDSNYVIDLKNNDPYNNAALQIYPGNSTSAQSFSLSYEGDGYYTIALARYSNMVFDVSGGVNYATTVNLYERNGTDAQLWKFHPVDGKRNTFTVVSKLGLNLTVNAIGGTLENTRMCTFQQHDYLASAQQFTIRFKKEYSSATENKTLKYDSSKLKKIGHQTVSGPCGCYCLAYADLVENGTVNKWQNFSVGYRSSLGRYSYAANWQRMKYAHHYTKSSDKIWKMCYNNIKNGKPTIVNVTGGRSSCDHYVIVIGSKNISDPNKLSPTNFLILDPAPHDGFNVESFTNVGYKLRADSDGDFDAIF